MATKGIWFSSANAFSTPPVLPIHRSSTDTFRRRSSSTTATAGKTCPPVPPPAITRRSAVVSEGISSRSGTVEWTPFQFRVLVRMTETSDSAWEYRLPVSLGPCATIHAHTVPLCAWRHGRKGNVTHGSDEYHALREPIAD